MKLIHLAQDMEKWRAVWMRWRTFGLQTMLEISWLAGKRLASQERRDCLRSADKWTTNHTHIFWHCLLLPRVLHVSIYWQAIISHWHKKHEKNKNLQQVIRYFYAYGLLGLVQEAETCSTLHNNRYCLKSMVLLDDLKLAGPCIIIQFK